MKNTTQGSTKTRRVGYWIATGLTAFAFLAGGAADLAASPDMLASMAHLGYPAYLTTILGVWKLLAPGFPRLKEWAYAGMAFDLTGAAISHAAVNDGAAKILTPLVLLGIVAASWALRPESRTLKASANDAARSPSSRPVSPAASLAT